MKIFKKISSVFVAVLAVCSMSVLASAAEVPDNETVVAKGNVDRELVLISDETYELDDEWTVTVKGYTDAENSVDGISTQSTGSGSDYYKYYYKFQKTAVHQTWDWLEMWVWGTFNWDTNANTVYVTGAGSDINILHGHPTIVSDTGTVSKDNQGATFLLGKRYGQVYRTIVMHNGSNLKNTFTVSIDVNVNGKENHDPNGAVPV